MYYCPSGYSYSLSKKYHYGCKRQIHKYYCKPILVYIDSFFIHDTLSQYIPTKGTKQILLFIVNVGYKDVEINKGYTLEYWTLVQYDSLSLTRENNNERIIATIMDTTSETNLKIL